MVCHKILHNVTKLSRNQWYPAQKVIEPYRMMWNVAWKVIEPCGMSQNLVEYYRIP